MLKFKVDRKVFENTLRMILGHEVIFIWMVFEEY